MINNELKKRIYTSLGLFIITILMIRFNTVLVFNLIILGVISVVEFLDITKKIIKSKLYFFISNLIFINYVFIFCFMFFFFSNFLELKIILFILLLSCISSDIGGFVFGKIFKGPKLTSISPNKTINGAIGSIIFTIIVSISLFFYFTKHFNFKILFIALLISIACQIGDIFFSYLKRKAKIKDTGNFLPGHGGGLDRLDGIFFGVPLGFILLTLFY